jgi:thiosulfate/3-mercaptopyruvate sulfurtransferase
MKSKKLNIGLVIALTLVLGYGNAQAAKWANPDLLVTAEQVNKITGDKNWVIVDCRDLPDYIQGHIPGSISLGKQCKKILRDETSRIYRDTTKYEKLLGKAGISNDTHVVFYYDGLKTLTDATVGFWVLEYLGHDKVHVLNGGLEAWRGAGFRLDNKPVKRDEAKFVAKVVNSRFGPTDEVLKIANGESKAQLVDSRSENEHNGKDIRAIRGGHVPNTTINVSHLDTLGQKKNPKTGKMETAALLDPDQAEKAFGKLDKNQRTLTYCQTGTRSTMTYLQLRLMGFKDPANWDESWQVYGSQLAYPVGGEQWFNFAGLNKKIKNLEKQVANLSKDKK